jgi:hypothetical protein
MDRMFELKAKIVDLRHLLTREFMDMDYPQMLEIIKTELQAVNDHLETYYNLQVSDEEGEQTFQHVKDLMDDINLFIENSK